MSLFSKVRAWFTPAVIDVLKAGTTHLEFPMGLRLVAIDVAKTRWTIIEGIRRARCNRAGCFHLETKAMDESFVFSLKEAREMVATELLSESRAQLLFPPQASNLGETSG